MTEPERRDEDELIAEAEFAISAKMPGDRLDYRIVRTSGGRWGADDLNALLRRLNVGELQQHDPSVPSAPWFIFAVADEPVTRSRDLLVIRQEWLDYADGFRRPVEARCVLILPYSDQLIQAGFLNLAAQVPPVSFFDPLLREDLPPDAVIVPLQQPEETARAIRRFGAERMLAVAASLLDSPLALVPDEGTAREGADAWPSALDAKLHVLTAVASLLPLGLRSNVAASTWINESEHEIRLGFGRPATLSQATIGWSEARTAETSLSGFARRYLAAALEASDRLGGLDELVRALGEITGELSFAHPELVVRAIDRLGRTVAPVEVPRPVETASAEPPAPPAAVVRQHDGLTIDDIAGICVREARTDPSPMAEIVQWLGTIGVTRSLETWSEFLDRLWQRLTPEFPSDTATAIFQTYQEAALSGAMGRDLARSYQQRVIEDVQWFRGRADYALTRLAAVPGGVFADGIERDLELLKRRVKRIRK
jgi:hypothetical protein